MKAIELIQRDIISERTRQIALREGLSPNSTAAQNMLKQELAKAKGKPIFAPNYARSGPLRPDIFTSQLKDIELDLMVALEATEQLDNESTLVATLSDIEHRINQADITRYGNITSYLKLGGLTFGDTFTSTDYVEVEKSTAVVDTSIGSVRHKTEIVKEPIELPSQELRLDPISAYTAVSGLTAPANLLGHRGPYTIIFQTTSAAGFTAQLRIKLVGPSTSPTDSYVAVNRILTLRSVVGYMELKCEYESKGALVYSMDTMMGMQATPFMIPDAADSMVLTMTKPSPDLDADGYSYYIFSLADLNIWGLNDAKASYIITKEIQFEDLSGEPIPLEEVTVVTRSNNGIGGAAGIIQPYLAICTENQPVEAMNWVPVTEGLPLKMADTYTGTYNFDGESVKQISTTELELVTLQLKPSSVEVRGGKGSFIRSDSRTEQVIQSITRTGEPNYQIVSSIRYIVMSWSELGLRPDDVIPVTGAITALEVTNRTFDPASLVYQVVGLVGQRQLRIAVPTPPPPGRTRAMNLLDGERYSITFNVVRYIEVPGTSFDSKILLRPGEQTTIAKVANDPATIKLIDDSTGRVTELTTTNTVTLTGPATIKLRIDGHSDGSLLAHFSNIDATKLYAEGVLTRTLGRPKIGEMLEINGTVYVGNPVNQQLVFAETGARISLQDILTSPAKYYELYYVAGDTSKTQVRLKFDILPTSGTFELLEYVAAFKPVGLSETAEFAYTQPVDNAASMGDAMFSGKTYLGRTPKTPTGGNKGKYSNVVAIKD